MPEKGVAMSKERESRERKVQEARALASSEVFEETAELLSLAGNSTRLKVLHLLASGRGWSVSDLAELVGVSVSAVSQHLAKLKAYGLVKSRRDAQTIYYELTEHPFNRRLAEVVPRLAAGPTRPPSLPKRRRPPR